MPSQTLMEFGNIPIGKIIEISTYRTKATEQLLIQVSNSKRACILIIYVDLMATKPMASSNQLHLEVIFWLLSPSTKFPLRTFNMLVLMDFIFNLECIYIYIVLQNICFGNCKFWELEMDFFPCLLSRSKNHGLNTNGYFHHVRAKIRPFCRLMNNSFY